MARPTCQFETITPAQAKKWLEKAGQNRKLRQSRVDLYAQMIARNDWFVTNQGIAFDEDEKLLDGQHRLNAIVAANVPVKMLVVRDLEKAAQMVIDVGAARQLHEQMRLNRGMPVLPLHIAVARHMLASTADSDTTRLMRRDPMLVERFYLGYRAAIDYAVTLFAAAPPQGIGGVRVAAVVAPVARAYYHTDKHERLDQFRDILYNGFADKAADSAAVVLRTYLMVLHSKVGQGRGFAVRREQYAHTEIAVLAFLERRILHKFPRHVDTTEELLPLPRLPKLIKAGVEAA